MDDLNLNTKNDDHLESLLNTSKRFSDVIAIQSDLAKCGIVTFKKGSQNIKKHQS